MTIGRTQRKTRKNNDLPRLLDHRTKAVLHAISQETKGHALNAYLRTILAPEKQ